MQATPVVVGCRERVEGFRDRVPVRARRTGVRAGPVLLASIKALAEQPAWMYRDEPARPRSSLPVRDRRRPGHYLAHKALVIVAPGARVTISGPAEAVAFAYDRDASRDGWAMRIPGRPAAVTFQACPPDQRPFSGSGRLGFTEFAGGIAVAGPRCVPLDIRDEESGRTWRRWVSFGTRGAGCPAPVAARPVRPVTLSCDDGAPLPGRALMPDWRRASVVAGPLTLYGVRDLARRPKHVFWPARRSLRFKLRHEFRTAAERRRARRTLRAAPRNGYGILEAMVVVAPGHTATVVVPALERRRLSLIYSFRARSAERPGAPGIVRISAGDAAVRFKSCPGQEPTHFRGGIVVARHGCVPLDVHPDDGPPVRVRLELGSRCR